MLEEKFNRLEVEVIGGNYIIKQMDQTTQLQLPVEPEPLDLSQRSKSEAQQKECDEEKSRAAVQKFKQFLLHSSHCWRKPCPQPFCSDMKKIIDHTRTCNNNNGCGDCSNCNIIISIFSSDVKDCQEPDCPVPFCTSMKRVWKLQQFYHEKKNYQTEFLREQTLRHRIFPGNSANRRMTDQVVPQQQNKKRIV